MLENLISIIYQANPWIKDPSLPLVGKDYIPRLQAEKLLSPEWDSIWLVLVGPRQAGKTTLAKYLAQSLVRTKRFEPNTSAISLL